MATVNMESTPNSNRYKLEQKKAEVTEKKEIKKVVTGQVTTKKKSEASKVLSKFVTQDADTIKEYIVDEVIIPGAKNLVSNILIEAVETIFGVKRSSRSDSRSGGGNYVSYRSYSDRKDDRRDDRPSHRFDYDEIEFSNRGDAEMVLDDMYDAVARYKLVTVADMYDMAGLTAPYTARNYGWQSIRSAEIVRVRNGRYVIKLPKPYPID